MSKFITNYTTVTNISSQGTNSAVVTEIDTPYGKGHRITSAGDNWQWIQIRFSSFSNSGILRFIARASANLVLRVYNENIFGSIIEPRITTDWSVIECEILKKPDGIGSIYGMGEGAWFEICDDMVLSDRDSLNQLDAINVPLFKTDTMPISINQGA